MEDTRSTKNPVMLILILIIVILLGLIYWLFSMPVNLPPVSGEADYLLSVNEEGEPLPYTLDGVPWVKCKPGQCQVELPDIDLGVNKGAGFTGFFIVKTGEPDKRGRTQSSSSFSLIESAYASDGICPIIGYLRIGGTWVRRYPPNDPDCPPN